MMQIGADSLNLTLSLDLLNPKSIGFDSVDDYYCAKSEVTAIRDFRFIVLIFPHTYTYTVYTRTAKSLQWS